MHSFGAHSVSITLLTAARAALDALYTANSCAASFITPGGDVDDVAVAALDHRRSEPADQPER
jgi:hypothetical protein